MIYQTDDTICAISTPHGTGGIAVIRISGPHAIEITDKLWHGATLSEAQSHTAHLGEITDPLRPENPLDQCVATIFRAPRSYTGEDTVELSVHGSKWVQRETINLLITHGCRLAEPGEYTRRALINGRIDLTQAEGVADIIASSSRAAHRIAMKQMKGSISRRLTSLRQSLIDISALLELELDFSEEDVEFADRTKLISLAEDILSELKRLHSTFDSGNAIKEGIPVAIAGATNAGKSSLLNCILQDDRAIVSDIHGTTRDTIEETLEIGDYLFRFIDTAGLRDTTDKIEQIGIARTRQAINKAHILILVIDSTTAITQEILTPINGTSATATIILLNKTDLLAGERDVLKAISSVKTLLHATTAEKTIILPLSTRTGHGLDSLMTHLQKCMSHNMPAEEDTPVITNLRQAQALARAIESTGTLLSALRTTLPSDLVAQLLHETLTNISTIIGNIPSSEILNTIFSRFCIGK